MSDALAVPESRVLAALSAGEMPAVQKQLGDWLTRKLDTLRTDLSMYEENLRIAQQSNWKTGAWNSLIGRTRRLFNYYDKLKTAVAEGYVIIPDLQATTIAVRVDREKPQRNESSSRWVADDAKPEPSLPAGQGRYVDDENFTRSYQVDTVDYQDKPTKTTHYFSSGFDEEIDFPILVVKPVVLSATQKAMSLKVFDRIGVVGARRKDPLVVGEILGPNGKKQVFFIAWWLDPETL